MKISRIGIVAVLSAAMIFGFSSFDTSVSGSTGGGGNQTTTYQFHSRVTYLAAGTDGTAGTGATYCIFGDWPQTIKAESVTVDETKSVTMGSKAYYLGSDSNYYAKCTENAYCGIDCGIGYTYSNGDTVAWPDENSTKYFRVEPIKWRVLNPSSEGNKILVAESILTAHRFDDGSNNYKESEIRTYLNGDFLNSAFTSSAQSLIATTTVDNSAASTNPASNAREWNSGTNNYACENTSDKIFLLSEKEATTSDYGFTAYDQSGTGNSRIRMTTDYAKANYAFQSTTAGDGGFWWLRSPYYDSARFIDCVGYASNGLDVVVKFCGVVPALCLE